MDYTYRAFLERILPSWLRATWSGRFLYTMALELDAIMQGVRDATRARFIGDAPNDALGYYGLDSDLDRYPPDTDDTYRARLATRFETWPTAGTQNSGGYGLIGQLNDFGFPNVTIWENHEIDNPWPHDADNWSRFWVILRQPHQYTWGLFKDLTWGSFTWGYKDGGGNPVDLDPSLRRLARKFKPAHVVCVELVLLGDTDTPIFEPTETWGSFNWGLGTNGRGSARIKG